MRVGKGSVRGLVAAGIAGAALLSLGGCDHLSAVIGPSPAMQQMGRYNEAHAALHAKEWAEGRRILEEVVAEAPAFSEAWYFLGFAEERLAHDAALEEDVERAAALYRSALSRYERAKTLMDQDIFVAYDGNETDAIHNRATRGADNFGQPLPDDDEGVAAWVSHRTHRLANLPSAGSAAREHARR